MLKGAIEMKKVDTHTHVLLTKRHAFSWLDVALHFNIARAQGLDVVCLTEHLDADNFTSLYDGIFYDNKLGGQKISDGMILLSSGLLVVSGTEIPLKGGGEVGLCSSMRLISGLNKENSYYSLDSLISYIDSTDEHYTLIGNHLRHPKKWISDIEKHIDSFDAIEVLSKYRDILDDYRALANSLGKPLVSGSDSHTWVQFGLSYTEVDIQDFSLANFKEAIRGNKFSLYMSDDTNKIIKVSELFRKNLVNKAEERYVA